MPSAGSQLRRSQPGQYLAEVGDAQDLRRCHAAQQPAHTGPQPRAQPRVNLVQDDQRMLLSCLQHTGMSNLKQYSEQDYAQV